MKSRLPLALIAIASLPSFAIAQSTQNSLAKPSPYQGTSLPSNAPILADDDSARAPAAIAQAAKPSPVAPAQPSQAAAAAPPQNPDAGIVESPLPPDASSFPEQLPPSLRSHVYNPDADIVTSVPLAPNQLGEGTPFHARLLEELSAGTITPGTRFTAQLTQNVMHNDVIVIPTGSYIHGRVTYVSAGRRFNGPSMIRLAPEEVVLPDGTHYYFHAVVTQTFGSNTKTDTEGDVIYKDRTKLTAAEYGMTAGSGAVIGAVVGGPVGAGVGGAIGAGLMTAHWLRERNAAVLPVNSQITFGLSAPLTLTPAKAAASSQQGAATNHAPDAPPAVTPYVEPKIQN